MRSELWNGLKKTGYEVWDVREVPEYQKNDIDFMIPDTEYKIAPDGSLNELKLWTAIEVKTDFAMSKTGNFFIELFKNRDGKISDGWFVKCKADEIHYVVPQEGIVYVIGMENLVSLIRDGYGTVGNFKIDAGVETQAVLLTKQEILPALEYYYRVRPY